MLLCFETTHFIIPFIINILDISKDNFILFFRFLQVEYRFILVMKYWFATQKYHLLFISINIFFLGQLVNLYPKRFKCLGIYPHDKSQNVIHMSIYQFTVIYRLY